MKCSKAKGVIILFKRQRKYYHVSMLCVCVCVWETSLHGQLASQRASQYNAAGVRLTPHLPRTLVTKQKQRNAITDGSLGACWAHALDTLSSCLLGEFPGQDLTTTTTIVTRDNVMMIKDLIYDYHFRSLNNSHFHLPKGK